jgi:hypothetical protein
MVLVQRSLCYSKGKRKVNQTDEECQPSDSRPLYVGDQFLKRELATVFRTNLVYHVFLLIVMNES